MTAAAPKLKRCVCGTCEVDFLPTRPWHKYAVTDGRSHRFRVRGRIVHVRQREIDDVIGLLESALAYVRRLRGNVKGGGDAR